MQGARKARRRDRPQTVVSSTDTESAGGLPASVRNARLLVLGAAYALLVLIFLRTGLMLSMVSIAGLFAFGIQALPMALLLPGLHASRPRTYAWLGFIVQFYFIHGVLLAFNPDRLVWGLAHIALTVLIFCGLIAFIRRYRRAFGAGP